MNRNATLKRLALFPASILFILVSLAIPDSQLEQGFPNPPPLERTKPDVELQTKAAKDSSALSWEQLENATYKGFSAFPEAVTLVNGFWEGNANAQGSALKARVNLVNGFRIVGDLGGDDKVETVVLLDVTTGNDRILHMAVVALQDGNPVNLATTKIGDHVQIRGGRILGGQIYMNVVRVGPDDAICCPGEVATQVYKLDPPGSLTPVAMEKKPERLTLNTIENSKWVLTAWDLDEPAKEEPEVTLLYMDGRFSGKNGCSNYFAPVTMGTNPGDVSVGQAGQTQMTCHDAESSVETRFMTLLAKTKKFGFVLGQLALVYENNGTWGTMLFSSQTR